MAKVKLYDESGRLLGFCDLSSDGSIIASSEVLGNVKVGNNINVAEDGTISVPQATSSALGVVKAFNVGGTYDSDAGKVTLTATESIANVAAVKELLVAGAIASMSLDNGGFGHLAINDSSTSEEQVVMFVGAIGGDVVAKEVIDAEG